MTDGRTRHILWNTCWFGSGEKLGCKRFWFVIVRRNATLSITSLRQHGNSFILSFSYSFGMLAVVLVQKLQCVPLNALTRLCPFLFSIHNQIFNKTDDLTDLRQLEADGKTGTGGAFSYCSSWTSLNFFGHDAFLPSGTANERNPSGATAVWKWTWFTANASSSSL